MAAGNKCEPIVRRAGEWARRRRPDSVEEIMIGAHHELVVFRSLIAGHVVAGVVVEMNTLQIRYVAIAVGQHYVERRIVDYEAIEVDGRQRKHGFDTVWSA